MGRRAGNPKLALNNATREIWASDYEFSFSPDENLCVIARPFSGDVVGIDTTTLRIKRVARLGQQPLDVAALPRGGVVARDWKTGTLLQGTLTRRWFGG